MGAKQSRSSSRRSSSSSSKAHHNVDLFTQYCIDDVELRHKVMSYIQQKNRTGGGSSTKTKTINSLQDLLQCKDVMDDIIAIISNHDPSATATTASDATMPSMSDEDMASFGTGYTSCTRSSIFDSVDGSSHEFSLGFVVDDELEEDDNEYSGRS